MNTQTESGQVLQVKLAPGVAICRSCGDIKTKSDFYVASNNKSGFRKSCKVCDNKASMDYSHTRDGWLTRVCNKQRELSKHRGMAMPNYTKGELGVFISNNGFNELFTAWQESNFDTVKRPSISRLDDYLPYTLDNIELLSWEDHRKVSSFDIRNGRNNKISTAVVGTKSNGAIVSFYSMSEAARKLDLYVPGISNCCAGKIPSHGGWVWSKVNNN